MYMVEREPQTFKKEFTSSERPKWKEEIKSEMDSILPNYTCELVDVPLVCKPLGYKWIFKRKMKVDRYKEYENQLEHNCL